MKKKYKNDGDAEKEQNLSEPSVPYITNNRRLHFFNSFEEVSRNEAKFIISQSPTDRLRQTVELILRAYNVTRQDLKERKSSNRIKIIRTK